ncbi:MAG: NAD(P)/FAD-dependent oxidoreductase [Thermoleophilaceae bacterium]
MSDAVVVGAGPNGLVAANMLASAGWEVTVLEAHESPGGAVRSGELTGVPGFRHDLFSAFYPLAAASPPLASLDLAAHGLRWRRSPLVVAHPTADGSCVVLSQDIDETAASFDSFARGDGDAWRRLYELFERIGDDLVDALLGAAFPPLRAGARLASGLRRDLLRFVRFGLLPARRVAEEEFRGEGAARMLAGNALHADLTPESAAGGLYGWLLCCLGQQRGWPVPEGGAAGVADALVHRLEQQGGSLVTGARVNQVVIRRGRAIGVRTDDGREFAAARAVVADVGAPALYLKLVGRERLPAALVGDLERFQYDSSTVKVDWALDAPIPWSSADARRAGTVHISEGIDALTVHASELSRGLMPARPFLLLGQYSMMDPTRAPAGAETAWAYTHTPQTVRGDAGGDGLAGVWDRRETELFVARMEEQIEALAPGFRDLVRARHVFSPRSIAETDENLVGGALGGGTAQLHQQLVFRPTPGLGRPETPIRGLYLGSASAHPGGGVHGACGANAARAILRRHRAARTAIAVGAGAAVGLGRRLQT